MPGWLAGLVLLTFMSMAQHGACSVYFEEISGGAAIICACKVAKRWHGRRPAPTPNVTAEVQDPLEMQTPEEDDIKHDTDDDTQDGSVCAAGGGDSLQDFIKTLENDHGAPTERKPTGQRAKERAAKKPRRHLEWAQKDYRFELPTSLLKVGLYL